MSAVANVTDRVIRLMRLSDRAHARFMRRSNRSIAQFPKDHERLHALSVEAARCANRIRAAERIAMWGPDR